MITPILTGNSPSGNITVGRSLPYTAAGANVAWTHFGTTYAQVMAVAGTFQNLVFQVTTPPGTGASWTMTLFQNGSPTALTCTISGTNTIASDTSHNITVTPGDTFGLNVTSTGTPAATTFPQFGMTFTDTNGGETFVAAQQTSTGPSNSTTNYISIGDGTPGATLATQEMVMPAAGTLDQMYIRGTAPGTGTSFALTVFKNGVSTGITATLSGTNVTATDLSHSVAFAAGDLITIQSVPSGTPTTGVMSFCFRFVPTTPGQSLGFTREAFPGNSTTVTNYMNSFGTTAGGTTTESNVYAIAPIAFTIQDLYFTSVASGTSKSRQLIFRQNGNNTALTTTLSGASQTTNSDTSDSISVSKLDLIDFASVPTGTPTTSTAERFSYVMYIPTSTTTTQTETGVARITTTTTQTETGVARVTVTTQKTETGVSRITTTTDRTETGVARVTTTTQKTETGVARIRTTTTKTETAVSRITVTTLKTETAVSRITAKTTKTETGVANIIVTGTTTKTETGVARITATTTKTETATARITIKTLRTETGVARILSTTTRTETGIARITTTTTRTETGVANIQTGSTQLPDDPWAFILLTKGAPDPKLETGIIPLTSLKTNEPSYTVL